jgi:tRNA-splicing ligase RtcB (3'-phosphate/5'-hydroxy nucleic acid ligase)
MSYRVPPSAIERLDPFRVRLTRFRQDMRVEGLIYASESLFSAIQQDDTLGQVANVATLPGILGPSIVMPDAHQGYGFAIGGVAATDPEQGGVVSPGGVGFDINCGVRLLATSLPASDLPRRLDDLVDALFQRVPVGFSKTRHLSVKGRSMDELLATGSAWVVRQGFGTQDDLDHTEERGCLRGAELGGVSARARERGEGQLGTLGSGNHFVEVQEVDRVEDEVAARALGLFKGQVVVLIHTGSRGLGHQVCTDHLHVLHSAMAAHGVQVPDRQLAAVPVGSEPGRAYLGAMAAAANYAWANRQLLTQQVRDVFEEIFGRDVGIRVVYDVSHNTARIERHAFEGRPVRVMVHRKGATRAFPAGHSELPRDYATVGQPVFIPGSMGTRSYVLVGTQAAMEQTWGSVCHGAGRSMSRGAARRAATVAEISARLAQLGVHLRAGSKEGIVEEAPEAYKDVSEVVATVAGAGIARIVARLRPMGVIKG